MAVVQEAFLVPDEIMAAINAGQMKRLGGVVRWAAGPHAGQIVKHLDPVDLQAAGGASDIGAKALQFVKSNKTSLIIVAVVVAGVTVGIIVYRQYKKGKKIKEVDNVRATLAEYTNAVRAGEVDIELINNLIDSIEAFKQLPDYENISLDISMDQLSTLADTIYNYTQRLAYDNNVELSERYLNRSDEKIVNLQDYLKTQKRIFEMA